MVCALSLVGCGQNNQGQSSQGESKSESVSGSITAVGSTALQPLAEAAAEKFQQENPDVQITVQGGGSGQGITQISEGSVQIGDSDIFAEDKLDDPAKVKELNDNRVCVVGMGPVVNPDVKVDNLTMDQLKGIFTGQITNWSQVGGQDEAITVINRASGSGTRATFEAAVLGDTKVPDSFKPQEQDSSGTVSKMVSETPGAISYLAFSYYDNSIKALNVDGVEPTADNVATNDWTIWSYEHMYTSNQPDDATQAFINYMMGDEVQNSLVTENGYIPISSMKVEKDAQGNVKTL
ncbi:MAG: phosphate ABC transporter substrate-binding protein PstS family protein [Eggerthellaceae bacterium]